LGKNHVQTQKMPEVRTQQFLHQRNHPVQGHIDAKTRRILCDNVQESVIEDAVCAHCGYTPERAEFGMSELAEIV
jgi:hypothetical protein